MKGVMALASQKVEEFTKEGDGWESENSVSSAFRANNVESAKSRLIQCVDDIREELERIGNTPELCSQLGAVLGILGDCCRAIGDPASAITYFEESVDFLSTVPKDDQEIIHTLSVSLNKIGDLKYYDGDLEAARSCYFKALNSVSSGSSWDDWDSKDNNKEESRKEATSNNNSWAGWDDKDDDDGFENVSNTKRLQVMIKNQMPSGLMEVSVKIKNILFVVVYIGFLNSCCCFYWFLVQIARYHYFSIQIATNA